ncbi:PUA-like domain-containing protein [Coprinopsis sp. MPI-PUGE-AT-0042]|nr:PUA-like domain-containing protein [Coprinopsis sp. MPI-PUGE-AT-0042]
MAMERMRRQIMAESPYFQGEAERRGPSESNPTGKAGKASVPVGTVYASRKACSEAGVHGPTFAGIHGSIRHGAYSIVMSGGYEDDQDDGDFIIYTGTGGQSDTFGERSQQVGDQSFSHKDNAALKLNTENGQPVRVVRGPNVHSKYAPEVGYRYDGLYKVEKACLAKGVSGRVICRYELRRIANQPPIPRKWN